MFMTRFRVWGLSALFAVGGGSALAASPPPPSMPEHSTLMQKVFGPKQPKPVGPTERTGPITITAPLTPTVLAESLRAEQDAYLRRVSVCTELRRVAVERGNDALLRQADELERQSGALYNARVASLGLSKVRVALPDTLPSASVADGGITPAQRAQMTAIKVKKLDTPTNPVPGTTTAQVREVPQ